jgi:hypothetical protein
MPDSYISSICTYLEFASAVTKILVTAWHMLIMVIPKSFNEVVAVSWCIFRSLYSSFQIEIIVLSKFELFLKKDGDPLTTIYLTTLATNLI